MQCDASQAAKPRQELLEKMCAHRVLCITFVDPPAVRVAILFGLFVRLPVAPFDRGDLQVDDRANQRIDEAGIDPIDQTFNRSIEGDLDVDDD